MVGISKDLVFKHNSSFSNSSSALFFQKVLSFLIIVTFAFSNYGYSQTTILFDNFESGTTNWTLQIGWGLTTSKSYSTSHSLTTGAYAANQDISATLATGVNLSSYKGAQITFYTQYDIEQYFDFVYVEISIDNGTNWYQVASFTGTLSTWTLETIDIGAFAGNSSVKVRFRLKSDQAIQGTGMYIDDFKITGLLTDNSAPFVVVQSPQLYQGSPSDLTVNANIFDASGIQSAVLYYKVDGNTKTFLAPSSISGYSYTFKIPAQTAGSFVYFNVGATDNSPAGNASDTSKQANSYVSGTYLGYDNGSVDAVAVFTSSTGNRGAAVKISAPSGSNSTLTSALIRNYKDPNTSNSQMLFHVWADNAGKPGTDLITPFLVTPAATLSNPYPMTLVDLRPYSSQLSNLNGDFYVGFTVPSGSVSIINSSTVTGNRSFNYNGTSWSAISTLDYEIRAVIQDNSATPVELTSFTAEVVNSGVELKWSTATEVNNFGFDVERKSENSDWSNIGFVPGSGNSNSPHDYSFVDQPSSGSSFSYRIKQIDNNGDYKYYDAITVSLLGSNKAELLQNNPNPFNPSTAIKFYVPQTINVTLKIYDILGKEVTTLVNNQVNAGYHIVYWNGKDSYGNNVSSGVYLYRLTAGNFVETKKMNLLK